jgi:hypothetical protein
MDQTDPEEDAISLREYAVQLCPGEAAVAFTPPSDDDVHDAIRSDIDIEAGGITWVSSEYAEHLDQVLAGPRANSPEGILKRTTLRTIAKAIVAEAAASRCVILYRGAQMPLSFFADRAAVGMIKKALEANDLQFLVRHGLSTPIASDRGAHEAKDQQTKFDAEKRRRIGAGEAHDRNSMTLWARHHFKVDSTRAQQLWDARSLEFSRRAGPIARSQPKIG